MGIINPLVFGNFGLFLLRITVGAIFVYHAIPKLQNPAALGKAIGLPGGAVLALGAIELLSGIALAFGVLVQVAAVLLGIVMIGAIYMKIVKWHVPFFAMDKTGWEFDLALLAANIAILFTNGGTISVLQHL